MLKDFYYSKKYEEIYMNNPGDKFIREVNINNDYKIFSICVEHGKPSGIKWDDVVFIGTANDNNCKYTKIK